MFCGDPRQILPVVCRGNQAHIVKACVHSSPLWNQIHQIQLATNMRQEVHFSSYLLTIGNGTAEIYPDKGEDMIQTPKQYLVKSIEEVIERTFPNIEEGYLDKYFMSQRAISTPKNDNVDKIREMIMEKFPGIGQAYLSADTVAEDELSNAYPTEFLNSITLSGMPPHFMMLKVGASVILLRESWSWTWLEEWYTIDHTEAWCKSFESADFQWCNGENVC